MPAPMMPPIASATRLSADNDRFNGQTSPPVSASAVSFASSSVDFRAQMFAKKCTSEKHCLSMIFSENRYPLFRIML